MNRFLVGMGTTVGLLAVCLGSTTGQGVVLPPRTPGQSGRPMPPPGYPGMDANPFDMGQVYPLAQPAPLPPVPPLPGRTAASANPSNPYGNPPAALPYPAMVPGSTSGYPRNRYSPSSDPKKTEEKPHDNLFSAGSFDEHEAMLSGLFDLKMREVKIQKRDVINVRKTMPGKEVSSLIQAVNANRRIYANADKLTARLQERGLLHPGDRVVGYADGKVYAVMGSIR